MVQSLFPDIEPFDSGMLAVSGGHRLYFEQCGAPAGLPVVFLHGGPGGGCAPWNRRLFDPTRYRVVLFDQRGCGRSTPHASLYDNTTWDLIEDIERLRVRVGVRRWLVFGGSWGSTLALAYAERYPERVLGLVLRGVFLSTRDEFDWFYRGGTARLFPDAWEDFVGPLDPAERADPLAAWYRRLTDDDAAVQLQAARVWTAWEMRTSRLRPDFRADSAGDHFALAIARIEAHYFVHDSWLRPNQLLDEIGRVAHLPCRIVQGRYDAICPPSTAWRLHRAWPGSELQFVDDAGHSALEPGILAGLLAANAAFAAELAAAADDANAAAGSAEPTP
jgi:proline iminopeptidase